MFFHIVNVSVRQKLIALQTNARNAKGQYFRETNGIIFQIRYRPKTKVVLLYIRANFED